MDGLLRDIDQTKQPLTPAILPPLTRLRKNIRRKPLSPQPLKPRRNPLIVNLNPILLTLRLLRNPHQHLLRRIAHLAAPAHEQLGSRVEQLLDLGAVVVQAVLDVLAAVRVFRCAREGRADGYRAHFLPAGEERGVQEVGGGGVAAVEEEGGREVAAGGELSGAFLDEAAEGGEACLMVSLVVER
jgi:hypothetical protein